MAPFAWALQPITGEGYHSFLCCSLQKGKMFLTAHKNDVVCWRMEVFNLTSWGFVHYWKANICTFFYAYIPPVGRKIEDIVTEKRFLQQRHCIILLTCMMLMIPVKVANRSSANGIVLDFWWQRKLNLYIKYSLVKMSYLKFNRKLGMAVIY